MRATRGTAVQEWVVSVNCSLARVRQSVQQSGWPRTALGGSVTGMSLRESQVAVDQTPVVPSFRPVSSGAASSMPARPCAVQSTASCIEAHHGRRGALMQPAAPVLEGTRGALSSRLLAPAPLATCTCTVCPRDAMLEMTAAPSARPDQRGPSAAATSPAQS